MENSLETGPGAQSPFAMMGKFALIAFGPAYAGLLFLFLPMLQTGSVSGILTFSFLLVLTVPVVWAAGRFLRGKNDSSTIFWTMFLAWQFFGFELGFVLASALAGLSMAVVDGAAVRTELWGQEAFFALIMLIPFQIFIFPWVVWSRRLLRAFVPDLFESPGTSVQPPA